MPWAPASTEPIVRPPREATCGLSVQVPGERVSSVRRDEEDPFSIGSACPRGRSCRHRTRPTAEHVRAHLNGLEPPGPAGAQVTLLDARGRGPGDESPQGPGRGARSGRDGARLGGRRPGRTGGHPPGERIPGALLRLGPYGERSGRVGTSRNGPDAAVSSSAASMVAPVEVTDAIGRQGCHWLHGAGHDVSGSRPSTPARSTPAQTDALTPPRVDPPSGAARLDGSAVEVAPE